MRGQIAVNSVARLIRSGDADIVIAGGTKSMSKAPFALKDARFGYRMGSLMMNINDYHMGITAENVAEKWGITGVELDAFSVASQDKAAAAIAEGRFKDEIVPVVIKGRKGDTVVDTDEGPRPGTTVEVLSRLKPAFKSDGIVTAGNSSGINDGAAAVILVSEDKVRELGLSPQAEWVGGALGGVDPAIMGVGPVESTGKLLKKRGAGELMRACTLCARKLLQNINRRG